MAAAISWATSRKFWIGLSIIAAVAAMVVAFGAQTEPSQAQVIETETDTPTTTPTATLLTVITSTSTLQPGVTPIATLGIPATSTLPPSQTPQGFIATTAAPQPPTGTPENCLTPRDFKIGDTVVLIGGISIRTEPNPDSALIIQFPERREFIVVGGPVCRDGFNYWNIQGHGLTGWAAEGRLAVYWMSLVRRAGEPLVPCLTPLKLTRGEKFNITFNVRVRSEPSLEGVTQTVVASGSRVTILEGPVCADGYNWWKVRAVVLGVTYDGWLAESSRARSQTYINPPTPEPGSICDFPLYLDIGDRVRVIYNDRTPKRLRSAPSLSATVLYDLIQEVPMVIIGGPVCADTYNWWQVRVLASTDVTGWLAEGGPAQYWIAKNELP
jgi:hypothetical protein